MASSDTSIPVPKILWDELENALMIKSKELIKDIAKVLRQDEKQLWQEFRSKKRNLHLVDIDSNQEEYECTALLCSTPVAHRCRKPVLFGKPVCPEHEYFLLPTELKTKPQLQRIEGTDEPLFVDSLTQQVYSRFYERKGSIVNNKCFVFEIEEG